MFLGVIFCSFHFVTSVLIKNPEAKQRNIYSRIEQQKENSDAIISVKQLAAIYGIEYQPVIIADDIVENEPLIIYLDQTKVIVKAVSRLGDKYFVVVDYQQQGETVRKKLIIGDQLLSYKLVGINKSALHFEDQSKKSLSFSIFKKSEQ